MSLFSCSHDEPYDEMLSLYEDLLENGANTNVQDKHGRTPLHHVVTELFESSFAISDDDIQIIKLLLKYKADPNAQDKHGRTAIMCFEPSRIRYCYKYLIFDALRDLTNLNIKDAEGRTFDDKYWKIVIEE